VTARDNILCVEALEYDEENKLTVKGIVISFILKSFFLSNSYIFFSNKVCLAEYLYCKIWFLFFRKRKAKERKKTSIVW